MIPRRPLLLITALVLALHALVLGGALPHGSALAAEAPLAFATRTIAAPPPAPSSRKAEAESPPPAQPAAARRAHSGTRAPGL